MKPLLLTLSILHGVDATQTQVLLRDGYREGNPLLPSSPNANLALKTAYATADVYLLHKTKSRWLTVAAIAVESYVVYHNATLPKGRVR